MIHAQLAAYAKGQQPDYDAWPALESFVSWFKKESMFDLKRGSAELMLRRKLGGVWLSGHVDLAYSTPACVIDWKTGHGWGHARIESDMQMLGYAYLVHRRTRAKQVEVMRIMVDEREVHEHVHDFSDGLIEEALTELVQEMADPEAELNPEVSGHCRFCFNRKTCPAYIAEARPLLGDELVDLLLASGSDMDVDKIAENLPAAATVVELVKELLPQKESKPRRKYKAWQTVQRMSALVRGEEPTDVSSVQVDAIDEVCSVSITAVEQLLRDHLNYNKEDLHGFWQDVERSGGRIA